MVAKCGQPTRYANPTKSELARQTHPSAERGRQWKRDARFCGQCKDVYQRLPAFDVNSIPRYAAIPAGTTGLDRGPTISSSDWGIDVPKTPSFSEFLKREQDPKKIRVEAPGRLLPRQKKQLDEATRKTVGNFTARRDPPHFSGDEYHAHAEIPGGYEVSWNVSGSRRHPKKFPATVPKDAKSAVAKVLKVSEDLLEAFTVEDPMTGESVLLLEYKAP